MDLLYKHEKPLFLISLVLSIAIWVVISVLAVVYLPFIALGYLFVQSAFISYIKGNGVKITETQFPDLHQRLEDCCRVLKMDKVPAAYIVNSDGILNALATKFLGRYYIVLYSDIVDALARHPDSVNFYIGHELGHIDRKHLNWALPLWPASLLPVLGYAYSRAREYTCDRYGIFCCERKGDAMFALAVLASGSERWRKIDMKEFVAQSEETGAFWMSFHEFTAGYPWLCKRMSWLRAIVAKQEPEFPRRNFISLILSLFVPSVGISRSGGGIVNLMVVVAIIGILSAVALPAYQDYINTANMMKVSPAFDYREEIYKAMDPYIVDNSELPFSLEQIGLSSHPPVEVIETLAIVESRIVLTLTTRFSGEEDTIVLIPYVEEGELIWSCSQGTLDEKYRPEECQQ